MGVSITQATYLGEYRIGLTFDDKTYHEIDFKDFLSKSKNPMTRKYLDKDLFTSFSIQFGDLVWNDFELSFPIWDLYTNNIEHQKIEANIK